MKTRLPSLCVFCVLAGLIIPYAALADLFGTGPNQFSIDFATIGHAGNTADSTGYGSVGYEYRIGRTEVSIDQFFKARAADARVGDGTENYWNDGTQTVGVEAPAIASWFNVAKFCNWLTTGDAHAGVYQFNAGGVLTDVDRSYRNGNGLAYVLPNEDEWYKAAYFKSDASGYSLYAHGLDTPPPSGTNGWNYFVGFDEDNLPSAWEVGTGEEEQNGTFDMMGNVDDWTESAADGLLDDMNEDRISRGGFYLADELEMRSVERFSPPPGIRLGFRVASIPEPSSALLLMVGAGGLLLHRRAQRRKREKWSRQHR